VKEIQPKAPRNEEEDPEKQGVDDTSPSGRGQDNQGVASVVWGGKKKPA